MTAILGALFLILSVVYIVLGCHALIELILDMIAEIF